MPKKRKNTQKTPSSRCNGKIPASGSNDTNREKKFHLFPLHLVKNHGYPGKDNYRELHELCKGRVWVIPSFFFLTKNVVLGLTFVNLFHRRLVFNILLIQLANTLQIENAIASKKKMPRKCRNASSNDCKE